MKRSVKKLVVCGIIALMVCALCSLVAFAAADKPEPAPQDSRQPEAADKIRTNMMLGLVFIETAIIYALVVAILIIFVL